MNPLRLTPPQWRLLRHLNAHSATAARTGYPATKLRALTGAGTEELIALADLGHIAGRLPDASDEPSPRTVRTAAATPATAGKLRIHLTHAGKNAARTVDTAYRALSYLRAHGPQPAADLQHDAGVDTDILTALESQGLIEVIPICPECQEPAQHEQPTAWTPAWGRAPSWSHLDGEPLCPVVGANGYEPATLTANDRRIVLTGFGRRYAEPYSHQDPS